MIASTLVQVLTPFANEASNYTSLTTTLGRCDGSVNHSVSGISGDNIPFRFVVLCLSSDRIDESASVTISLRNKYLLDDSNIFVEM